MDDIVEGKSGGRTVLCSGPPGVGKEENLKDVLIRAQHWGAVILIDETIIFRCIAMIRHKQPGECEREKFWQVISNQFGLRLSQEMCNQHSTHFPKTSGRDIKGLAKLVARFCTYRSIQADMGIFEYSAKFRAIESA